MTVLRFTTLLVLAGALVGCRGQVSDKPPIHLNPNMDNVDRYDGQEPSSFWEDGRSSRTAIAGTVAIGQLREDTALHAGVDAGGKERQGPRSRSRRWWRGRSRSTWSTT